MPCAVMPKKPTGFMDLPRELRQRILSKAAGVCNLRRETAQLIANLPKGPNKRYAAVYQFTQVENFLPSDPAANEISKSDAVKYAEFHRLYCINSMTRLDMIYVEWKWLTEEFPVDIFDLPYWKPSPGQKTMTVAINPHDARVRHFNNRRNEVLALSWMTHDQSDTSVTTPYYFPEVKRPDDYAIVNLIKKYVPQEIEHLQLSSPSGWSHLYKPSSDGRMVEWISLFFRVSRKHCKVVFLNSAEKHYDGYCHESPLMSSKDHRRYLMTIDPRFGPYPNSRL